MAENGRVPSIFAKTKSYLGNRLRFVNSEKDNNNNPKFNIW